MNCCNDYGTCQQGHDCPARTTPLHPAHPAAPRTDTAAGLALWALAAVAASACAGLVAGVLSGWFGA